MKDLRECLMPPETLDYHCRRAEMLALTVAEMERPHREIPPTTWPRSKRMLFDRFVNKLTWAEMAKTWKMSQYRAKVRCERFRADLVLPKIHM